jgi:hypothetical protein
MARDETSRLAARNRCALLLPNISNSNSNKVGVLMLICAYNIYVQKKRSTQIVTAQQLDESSSRPAVNSIQCRAVKPERVSRLASSTRTAKTARFAGLLAESKQRLTLRSIDGRQT